ncbi:MAG: hypothetical protein IPI22_15105 [Bacteroidetes bacterium]|nr:hypothetical protein [Bacteroidota bacterium]
MDTNTGLTIDEKVVNAPNGSQLKVSDDGKLLVVDSSGKETLAEQLTMKISVAPFRKGVVRYEESG